MYIRIQINRTMYGIIFLLRSSGSLCCKILGSRLALGIIKWSLSDTDGSDTISLSESVIIKSRAVEGGTVIPDS